MLHLDLAHGVFQEGSFIFSPVVSFVQFDKRALSVCYIAGTVLGAEHTVVTEK